MTNASVLIKVVQSAGIAAVAATVLCTPMVALAQTLTPPAPRPVQAQAKPKPAPQPTAAQSQPVPVQAAQGTISGTTQGLATGKAAGGEDVIARVGNVNVSADDLRSYVAALGPREQAALAKDPALLSQAVRLLLANRLVLQEALAKKWDQKPAVAAQLDRMRESAVVELYLQSVTTPPANFPSDDDVQKVYDANRSAFLMPRQFQLAQIFIAAPKEADKAAEDKAKQELDDVVRKLKVPGADFGAIASSSNNDAKDGGDLGWVAENQIRPEIRTQVMGLTKNTVSDPVKLDDGWHILKLIDTKASYTRTLPEVREQLVQQIRSERATMLRRAYLADLQKQNPPVLNELALSNLLDNSRK
ncbi:peptidylprolyl isomerase [Bradyrhizobium prioriisuperbiae]|uniref:peptidylprolyl isomerase n=1 Tax=Bradyrhizobium prioriisuperbiae TaxID=2854389 RepID=UPI0028E572F5|nr:peptidylprolyl isomerase [Bradyrhizobium prioritasuperba]